MSFGKTRQSYEGKVRAIALIALVLIIFGVSCNSQPSPQISSSALTIVKQSTTPTSLSPTLSTTTSTAQSRELPSSTSPSTTVQTRITPTDFSNPQPTLEPGVRPYIPIVGNADKIAFINQNEVWMANLDGNELTRLTGDSLPKSFLQWSPDNQGVIYLSGVCAYYVYIHTRQIIELACFEQADRLEAFQFSPNGEQVAVSLDGQLYVIPYDEVGLSQVRSGTDLAEFTDCDNLAPYRHRQSMVTVSRARWSSDGDRLAILRQGYDSDRHVELIHILDISRCIAPLPRLDEFPATRFSMDDYEKNPIIQDFAWDGGDLFALTSYKRNDGFGDLWVYNTNMHRGFKANPIDGKCCYRDPVFSPDGKYLAFVFQDAGLAPNGPAKLFYLPYAALDTSLVYPPLPLPPEFFTERRSKPQPVLRPAP
jgi:dipeptidyl aminopeptidase/acylaminoacyl peptidase